MRGTQILIGVLCAAALLLILLVMNGGWDSEGGARAIVNAGALALLSLTAMSGRVLAERRPSLAPLGYATMVVSLAALVAVTVPIWSDAVSGDNGWRPAAYLLVLSLGGANACLLLSIRGEGNDAFRLVRAGVIVAIVALCAMAIVEISAPSPDVSRRAMAVVAILYVLGTVLLPLLRRASRPAQPPHLSG